MQVSQLIYYPVKSMGGVQVEQLRVTEWGPHRDRRLMLVDANGKFVTQRQCPQMALMKVVDNGHSLLFRFQNSEFELVWPEFDVSATDSLVRVWDDEVAACLVSQKANEWFSEMLGGDYRLVMMPQSTVRQVDLDYAKVGDKTGFSDGFPFLLISEASLEFLQSKLSVSISMNRFRPNIVVKGCEPFAEDTWRRIAIGGIEYEVVKPCSRCVIPTLNPQTAERQPEVMQVMLAHRKQGNKVYVGQNLIHRGEGLLEVGDEIEILE